MVRSYFESVFLTGRGGIGPADAPSRKEIQEAVAWIAVFEQDYRLHLAGTPPALHLPALTWAVGQFYRASQCFAHRHLGEEVVSRDLAENAPVPSGGPPASLVPILYSVDLVFRFLPDLYRLAKAASEGDPLGQVLLRWGREWPLSSVGMPLESIGSIEPIVHDPCLRSLYVDRIVSAGDRSRLADPRIREAIRVAGGAHAELVSHLPLPLESPEHLAQEPTKEPVPDVR